MLAAASVFPASFRPLPPFSRRGPLFPLLFLALFLAFPLLTHAAPNLYVSSSSSQNIQTFDKISGASTGLVQLGASPAGLAFGPDGALYVAATGSNDILRYDPVAGTTSVFVTPGAGGLHTPLSLAFGPDGALDVLTFGSVLRYDGKTGAFLNTLVSANSGLYYANNLVFGPDGSLYISGNGSVLHYNGTTGATLGTFVPAGSGGLAYPFGLAFGLDGNLYVVSNNTNSVLRYDGVTGAFLSTFVAGGSGGLTRPTALAFGPDGALYVTSSSGNGPSSVLRYSGTTGAFLNTFAGVSGSADALAFVPVPPAATAGMELITNGGFETGDLTGWTTFNQLANAQTQSSGTFTAAAGVQTPATPPTVGPKSGTYYALGTERGPTASALSQTFTVPGPAKSVILSFDMFVDDYSQYGPQINPAGLDYTANPNQQARVDLLLPTAAPLSTAPGDVLQNFYGSVDSHSTPNPHGYTHYSFDITSLVGKGGTYTLRYALVNNQAPLNQGVDNVSVQYVAGPAPPPAPLTLSVSPASVTAGTPAKLTVTLASPAPASSPDPLNPSQTDPGAYVQLSASSLDDFLYSLDPSDGQLLFGGYSNGTYLFYLHFNPGQTTATTTVLTTSVSTVTKTTLTGQYGGGTASTGLTLTPNKVASLTLNTAAVYGGLTTTATVTLIGQAGFGPDPYHAGSMAPGEYVQVTAGTAGVSFPNNSPAPDGKTYVLVSAGQTAASFTVATSPVTAQTTASISGALNGSSASASLLILPPAPTVTTLTSSLNPSAFGQPVTFTATVSSGGSPTGTVTFTVDGVAGTPVTLSGGTAAYPVPLLSAGTHTVTVSYSGDFADAASGSAALTQTVKPAATATTLVSSANPSALGLPVMFTATVTAATGVTPSGVVTFSDSGIVLGTASVNAQGQAVFQTTRLKLGTHRITASLAVSASFGASVSAALTQRITVPVLEISAVVGKAGRDTGGNATVTVLVINKGNVPATVTVVGSALGFVPAASVSPVTLAPGASQTLMLTFPGVAAGSRLFLLALSGTSSALPGQTAPFVAVQDVQVP